MMSSKKLPEPSSRRKQRTQCMSTVLPPDFYPSKNTVVIGKGGIAREAEGNEQLRTLVKSRLQEYSNAKTRNDKSMIVSDIYQYIQRLCPVGTAFVKYDGGDRRNGNGGEGCRFWTIPERHARDKICTMFRDCLQDQYKSSSKNKSAKRKLARRIKREQQQQQQKKIMERHTVAGAHRHFTDNQDGSIRRSSIVVTPTPYFEEPEEETIPCTLLLERVETISMEDVTDLSDETFDRTFFDNDETSDDIDYIAILQQCIYEP